jgi:hypothetical protein
MKRDLNTWKTVSEQVADRWQTLILAQLEWMDTSSDMYTAFSLAENLHISVAEDSKCSLGLKNASLDSGLWIIRLMLVKGLENQLPVMLGCESKPPGAAVLTWFLQKLKLSIAKVHVVEEWLWTLCFLLQGKDSLWLFSASLCIGSSPFQIADKMLENVEPDPGALKHLLKNDLNDKVHLLTVHLLSLLHHHDTATITTRSIESTCLYLRHDNAIDQEIIQSVFQKFVDLRAPMHLWVDRWHSRHLPLILNVLISTSIHPSSIPIILQILALYPENLNEAVLKTLFDCPIVRCSSARYNLEKIASERGLSIPLYSSTSKENIMDEEKFDMQSWVLLQSVAVGNTNESWKFILTQLPSYPDVLRRRFELCTQTDSFRNNLEQVANELSWDSEGDEQTLLLAGQLLNYGIAVPFSFINDVVYWTAKTVRIGSPTKEHRGFDLPNLSAVCRAIDLLAQYCYQSVVYENNQEQKQFLVGVIILLIYFRVHFS